MSNSNNRAMLLSGLRTGGVRPSAGPTMPQTAAINGSFQAPRFASHHQQQALFEENMDDMNSYANMSYGMPMTAALDGRAPRFQQQQQLQFLQHQARLAVLNPNNGMNGMNPIDHTQAQFMQLQLMQAMVAQQQQAQKLQAELAMQQQVAMALSGQRQAPNRVVSTGSRMPSTAGPSQTTFEVPAMSRMRSEPMTSVDEKTEIGIGPMTAALGGKFGSRSLPTGLNPNAPTFKMGGEAEVVPFPATPSTTVVISGGVSLGAPSTPNPANSSGPSKSDAAVSWRRGSNAASATFNRSGSPPKIIGRQSPPTAASPEPATRESPPLGAGLAKYRPQPLRIRDNQAMMPSVTIENEQGISIYSSAKMPSPTGSNSSGDSHKKYEAPGKTPLNSYNGPSVRHSQPLRQPRGPPAAVEEISSLNFASRVKRIATNPMVMTHEPGFVEAY